MNGFNFIVLIILSLLLEDAKTQEIENQGVDINERSMMISLNPEGVKLENTRPYSLMIGFNSNLPTMYIGPSNGNNTSGEVGIGTTHTNGFKLNVAGDAQIQRLCLGGEYIPEDCILSVEGKIFCEDLHVSATEDWPDYVFEENFELLSIDEMEQYVKEKKHLPGMPTKSQVLLKGITQTEMNEALLKKIEELSLYIIGLNQELKQLKEIKLIGDTSKLL